MTTKSSETTETSTYNPIVEEVKDKDPCDICRNITYEVPKPATTDHTISYLITAVVIVAIISIAAVIICVYKPTEPSERDHILRPVNGAQ